MPTLLSPNSIVNSASNVNSLYTPPNITRPNTTLLDWEQSIFKNLVKETPNNLQNVGTAELLDDVNSHLLIRNNHGDSNLVIHSEYVSNTAVVYPNSSYLEELGPSKSRTVTLGANTAPIYTGNVSIEYSQGSNIFTSGGHTITLDTTNPKFNIFKAMQAQVSNLASNATNALTLNFNNDFNSSDAFLSAKRINRTANNTLVNSGIISNPATSVLDCSILDSTTDLIPFFGSTQFVQPDLNIAVTKNLPTLNPSLQLLNNSDNSIGPVNNTYTESNFLAHFLPADQVKLGNRYNLKISMGNDNLGSYSITSTANHIPIKTYNSNNVLDDNTNTISLFTLDDSDILPNFSYMKNSYENNLFSNHYLSIKNGEVSKDSNYSSDPNYNAFEIADGTEALTVVNATDIDDLTKDGSVSFAASNSILGDSAARYRKVEQSLSDSINSLVVSYANNESDYRSDSGIISSQLQNTAHVSSKIKTILKSTKDPSLWTGVDDIMIDNNVHLGFQYTPKSNFYDATNILSFSASGISRVVNNNDANGDNFGLLALKKVAAIGSIAEYDSFLQSSNNTPMSVKTSVSLTQIDLNTINAAGLRVNFLSKLRSDLPVFSNLAWEWYTGRTSDGDLDIVNNIPENGNSECLLSYVDGNTELFENYIYDIMNASSESPLEVNVNWKTTGPTNNKEGLFNHAEVSFSMTNVISPAITKIIDSKNIKLIDIVDSDTKTNLVEIITNFSSLKMKNGSNVPLSYKVYSYQQVKKYRTCIKFNGGSIKNAWIISPIITEYTNYYEVFSTKKNSFLPDYHNKLIVDSNNQQRFLASRFFNTANNYSVSTSLSLRKYHLMAFKAQFQYNTGVDEFDNKVWENFTMIDSTYNSIDLHYDTAYEVQFGTSAQEYIGTMTVNVDVGMNMILGKDTDKILVNSQKMYHMPIESSSSENQFIIDFYKYSKSDVQYFHDWNPYGVGNEFFPVNNLGQRVGTKITNVETLIEYSTVNNVEVVKFSLMDNNGLIMDLTSTKDVLECFNVCAIGDAYVQHEFTMGDVAPYATQSEYLKTKPELSEQNKNYVNLLYGNSTNSGVYAKLNSNTNINDYAIFELNSDSVKYTPIINPSSTNSYSGKYADYERIGTTSTGKPLPSNSTKTRNVFFNRHRGNTASTVLIKRTATTVKFVASDDQANSTKLFSSLDSNNVGAATVWAGRNDYTVNNIQAGIFSLAQQNDISLTGSYGSTSKMNLGNIGLKFGSNVSMLSQDISTHIIPITLNLPSLNCTVTNPLDPTLNQSITFPNNNNPIIKNLNNYSLITTTVKLKQIESYEILVSVPDLVIRQSNYYVGDVTTFSDWTVKRTVSDDDLRIGIIDGVVSYKRTQIAVKGNTSFVYNPRPTATITAYNINDLGSNSLPFNLNAISKQMWSFDINIDQVNQENKYGHFPMNIAPASNVPNAVNAVSDGFNNFKVELNISKYLFTRQAQSPVTFSIPSNNVKLTTYSGISPSVTHPIIMYNGPIQDLTNLNNWTADPFDSQKIVAVSILNNTWFLKFRQNISSVSQFTPFINITTPNIEVTGISNFGTNSYKLDLQIADSIRVRQYTVDYGLTSNNEIKATLNRYTTATTTTWETSTGLEGFNKSWCFKPMMLTRETSSVTLNIPNTLTSTPYNAPNLIKNAIDTANFSAWTTDTNYQATSALFSMTPLSITGTRLLSQILFNYTDSPFKLFSVLRQPIMEVRGSDGSLIMSISNEGRMSLPAVSTYELALPPQYDYNQGLIPSIGSELLLGSNVVPARDES